MTTAIEQTLETYGIENWGAGYFGINRKGNLVVHPAEGDSKASADVKEIIDDLRRRGISTPVLLRFPQLVTAQVRKLQRAFRNAIAIEPRFADAHAGLGDTEAAAGDWRSAASAYADAARYAPRWGKLHLKWAAALWNGGRQGEARAKLDAASTMALSGADRALLGRLQATAAQ